METRYIAVWQLDGWRASVPFSKKLDAVIRGASAKREGAKNVQIVTVELKVDDVE